MLLGCLLRPNGYAWYYNTVLFCRFCSKNCAVLNSHVKCKNGLYLKFIVWSAKNGVKIKFS